MLTLFAQCYIGWDAECVGRHGAKSDVVLYQIAFDFPALTIDRDEVPPYHHAIVSADCS